MQKKFLSLLVTFTAAAALLSGCGESHTHQTSDRWDADLTGHWKTCLDCGQDVDKGEHTPGDDAFGACTVCGAEIIDWDDSKSLYQYNESGDPLKLADYDLNGNLITEIVYTYEYDADGTLTHSSTATDGVLTEETTYVTVDGEALINQVTIYMEDGSKSVSEYDVYGNELWTNCYDADGELGLQTESEYALSADGEWYEAVCVTIAEDRTKIVSSYYETGNQESAVFYDSEGNLLHDYRWEYTYDEDGNWQTMKHYCNGILSSETIYATVTDGDFSVTFPETVTEYDADGGKTVTVIDENDNIISQIRYDADGNAISD